MAPGFWLTNSFMSFESGLVRVRARVRARVRVRVGLGLRALTLTLIYPNPNPNPNPSPIPSPNLGLSPPCSRRRGAPRSAASSSAPLPILGQCCSAKASSGLCSSSHPPAQGLGSGLGLGSGFGFGFGFGFGLALGLGVANPNPNRNPNPPALSESSCRWPGKLDDFSSLAPLRFCHKLGGVCGGGGGCGGGCGGGAACALSSGRPPPGTGKEEPPPRASPRPREPRPSPRPREPRRGELGFWLASSSTPAP